MAAVSHRNRHAMALSAYRAQAQAHLTPHAALSTGDGQQQTPLHASKVSAPHVVSAGAFGAGGRASGAGGAIAGAAARGGICSGGASFCSGGICSGGGCRGGDCAAAPWALCKEPCSAAPTAARLCVKHGKGHREGRLGQCVCGGDLSRGVACEALAHPIA